MRNLFAALVAPLVLVGALAAQGNYSWSDIGPGCANSSLSASFSPIGGGNNQMTLTIASDWTKEKTLTFWGVDTLGVAFPGTSCTFYFNAFFVHPGQTDTNGIHAYTRSWPATAIGWYKVQSLVYRLDANGQLEWQLTNGIRVENS